MEGISGVLKIHETDGAENIIYELLKYAFTIYFKILFIYNKQRDENMTLMYVKVGGNGD